MRGKKDDNKEAKEIEMTGRPETVGGMGGECQAQFFFWAWYFRFPKIISNRRFLAKLSSAAVISNIVRAILVCGLTY